jgi:hypothetical protein
MQLANFIKCSIDQRECTLVVQTLSVPPAILLT